MELLRFVGIDSSVEAHDVCVLDPAGELLGERRFSHDPEGLLDLVRWITEKSRVDAPSTAVGLESPHGALVDALIEAGYPVFAINPKQLDRFRDRFTTAGAKDDRLDARVLADSLRTDRRAYRHLEPDLSGVIELREWSRMRDDLQAQRVAAGHQLRQQLRRYYPQVLELGDDITSRFVLAVLEKAPTPKQGKKLSVKQLRALMKKYRIRRIDVDQAKTILRGPGFKLAEGTVAAASAHVRQLVVRLRLVKDQLTECDRRISELLGDLGDPEKEMQRDVEILQTFPGNGRIVLAALLSEAGRLLLARDYQALRVYGGVAPVTRQSGRARQVVMRRACNPRLRQALYHWARVAVQRDEKWKARYRALRRKGHGHGRSLRTVADRMLNVACAMLRDSTPYAAA